MVVIEITRSTPREIDITRDRHREIDITRSTLRRLESCIGANRGDARLAPLPPSGSGKSGDQRR
jgi:hypothetical protein